MGCDIHTVIEEKVKGKWIGVVASDRMLKRPIYAQRDYQFFGAIANVRVEGSRHPKNVPVDVSDLSWHLYMRHPTDHHSASYMSIEEFCIAHNKCRPDSSRLENCVVDLTGISLGDGEHFRVVFWFDN